MQIALNDVGVTSDSDVDAILRAADKNGDGSIDYEVS